MSQINKIIDLIGRNLGLEIRRISPKPRRMSWEGGLGQAKKCGFSPATVFDVGAAFGEWTEKCSKIFPQAHYFLFEPLKEYQLRLQNLVQHLKQAKYFPIALGAGRRQALINVHQDWVGSSFFQEREGASVDGQKRAVPVQSLDEIVAQTRARPPYLMKLDVQGAELDVLEGAGKTLEQTEYMILEVCLFETMLAAPLFFEVLEFMQKRDFVLYDVLSLGYRPLDLALHQLDIALVKKKSSLRQDHRFCTRNQRLEQDQKFRRENFFKLHS